MAYVGDDLLVAPEQIGYAANRLREAVSSLIDLRDDVSLTDPQHDALTTAIRAVENQVLRLDSILEDAVE